MENIEQRIRKLEMSVKDFEEDLRKAKIEIDTLFLEIKKLKEK